MTIGFPLVALFLQSIFPNIGQGSLAGAFVPYVEAFQMEGLGRMWRNSFACASLATLLAWGLGIPAGWLLARAKLRARSLLRLSLLLPVFSPPYLTALAYVVVFQKNGLFDSYFTSLPDFLRDVFFSIWGVVFVMALSSFGTVALLVESALQGLPTRLEDAAKCLGGSARDVFFRITAPLLLPAIINSGVLVFVDSLSNFGIAAILGPRSNLMLLPEVVYGLLTTWPVNLPAATAVSSLLAISAIVMVSAARVFLFTKVLGQNQVTVNRPIQLSLFHSLFASAFFGLLFFFSSIIPTATVFLMSVVGKWQDGAPVFTLQHYAAIFHKGSGGLQALSTSAGLSAAAATACVLLGGVIAYALARFRGRGVVILDHLSMLPRVIPNLVIAVGLILAWNSGWMPLPVYGTLTILFLGYVAIYQAVGLRFADSAMQNISPRLEHVAACLGASSPQIFRRIIFPMMAPSLFVGWVSIFVMCLRDWVASIMLLPPGEQTVGSFIFSQFEQGDFAQAMAMAVCTVIVSTVLLLAANFRFYKTAIS